MPGFQSRSQNAIPVFQVDDDGVALGSAAAPIQTVAASPALAAGTDRSGTTSATANTSTTLAAANTTRRGLNIQNISANPIGINEFGGAAAIGTPGTYTLAAGSAINVRTNRAVTVVSGTASQPYTATEF